MSARIQPSGEFVIVTARSCPTGLLDGVWMNSLNRQRVMSHLVSQVHSAHALLVFPCASFVSCLACTEKEWWDCSRFRYGALVVTILRSVWWSSASAPRDKARHCLFLRMSGGVIPLTTGSMKFGVDRMHPDPLTYINYWTEHSCTGMQWPLQPQRYIYPTGCAAMVWSWFFICCRNLEQSRRYLPYGPKLQWFGPIVYVVDI